MAEGERRLLTAAVRASNGQSGQERKPGDERKEPKVELAL
jgi:hypothetical protein